MNKFNRFFCIFSLTCSLIIMQSGSLLSHENGHRDNEKDRGRERSGRIHAGGSRDGIGNHSDVGDNWHRRDRHWDRNHKQGDHHPWHDWYWYGNGPGYWDAGYPGYYNDPNYYYYGTPTIYYQYSAIPSESGISTDVW